jgi:hypothetical protein
MVAFENWAGVRGIHHGQERYKHSLCSFKVGYKAATGVRHSVHFPAAKGGGAVFVCILWFAQRALLMGVCRVGWV